MAYTLGGKDLAVSGNPARLHEREYIEIINVIYREDKPPCKKASNKMSNIGPVVQPLRAIPRRLRTVHVKHSFKQPSGEKRGKGYVDNRAFLDGGYGQKHDDDIYDQIQGDDDNGDNMSHDLDTNGLRNKERYESNIRDFMTSGNRNRTQHSNKLHKINDNRNVKQGSPTLLQSRNGTKVKIESNSGAGNQAEQTHYHHLATNMSRNHGNKTWRQGDANELNGPRNTHFLPPINAPSRNNGASAHRKKREINPNFHLPKINQETISKEIIENHNGIEGNYSQIKENITYSPQTQKKVPDIERSLNDLNKSCGCEKSYVRKAMDWANLLSEYREEILKLRTALKDQANRPTGTIKVTRDDSDVTSMHDVIARHKRNTQRLVQMRVEEKMKHEQQVFERLSKKFWGNSMMRKAKNQLQRSQTGLNARKGQKPRKFPNNALYMQGKHSDSNDINDSHTNSPRRSVLSMNSISKDRPHTRVLNRESSYLARIAQNATDSLHSNVELSSASSQPDSMAKIRQRYDNSDMKMRQKYESSEMKMGKTYDISEKLVESLSETDSTSSSQSKDSDYETSENSKYYRGRNKNPILAEKRKDKYSRENTKLSVISSSNSVQSQREQSKLQLKLDESSVVSNSSDSDSDGNENSTAMERNYRIMSSRASSRTRDTASMTSQRNTYDVTSRVDTDGMKLDRIKRQEWSNPKQWNYSTSLRRNCVDHAMLRVKKKSIVSK